MTFAPGEMRALRILVVDDEENIRFALTMCLETDGHKVVAVGTIEKALETAASEAFDLIFLDVRLGTQNGLDYIKTLLSESPWARIVVITAYASVETAVEAMKLGATDYLAKPFEPAQLTLLTQKVAERRQMERKIESLQKILGSMDPESDFPTASPIQREAIELARRVATANAPVLIGGERGVGRGRLARAIHEWSWRVSGPFVAVTLEGQTPEALEAELFGPPGDATPSAANPPTGAIPFCHGGTLLLDEVGNLPLRLQPRLVTLMRDKEFERPDRFVRRPIDVRIIATTSQDLPAMAMAGKFREDLFMALNVTRIDLPALRERAEDILPLAERYLAHFTREHHRSISGFSKDAAFVLKSHSWPGNVRELRNVIERSVLLCAADAIGLEHLPPNLKSATTGTAGETASAYRLGDMVPLDVIEESHIRQVLAAAGSIRRAAAILGVNASALCRKLKRLESDQLQAESEQMNEKPA